MGIVALRPASVSSFHTVQALARSGGPDEARWNANSLFCAADLADFLDADPSTITRDWLSARCLACGRCEGV